MVISMDGVRTHHTRHDLQVTSWPERWALGGSVLTLLVLIASAGAQDVGGSAVTVYDNTYDVDVSLLEHIPTQPYFVPTSSIDMDHAWLDTAGQPELRAFRFGYVTDWVGTVDITIRLHQAPEPGGSIGWSEAGHTRNVRVSGLPGRTTPLKLCINPVLKAPANCEGLEDEEHVPCHAVHLVEVLLDDPIPLRDGPLGISFQAHHPSTGPVLNGEPILSHKTYPVLDCLYELTRFKEPEDRAAYFLGVVMPAQEQGVMDVLDRFAAVGNSGGYLPDNYKFHHNFFTGLLPPPFPYPPPLPQVYAGTVPLLPASFWFSIDAGPTSATTVPAAPVDVSDGARVVGRINDLEDVDEVRLAGFAGERVSLVLRRTDGVLVPRVELLDARSGAVLAAATAKGKGKKAALKRVELPASGPYLVRVIGVEGSKGGWELRVRSVKPKGASKRVKALAEPGQGPAVAVIPARRGSVLDLTVAPKPSVDAAFQVPTVTGPHGLLDLTGHLHKDGAAWRIDALTLPADGEYHVRGGEAEPGAIAFQRLKARVSWPKRQHRALGESDRDLRGLWVREGFNTEGNAARLSLTRDGTSAFRVTDGPILTTWWLKEWTVTGSIAGDEYRTLSYAINAVDGPVTFAPSAAVAKGGSFSRDYIHPEGNPDQIMFVDTAVTWHRVHAGAWNLVDDAWEGVPVELLSGDAAVLGRPGIIADSTDAAGPADLAVDHPRLRWERVPSAVAYSIHRAPGGTPLPPRNAHDVFIDNVPTLHTDGRVVWVDTDTGPGQTWRYWVRALLPDRRPGRFSESVEVQLPAP